MSNDKARVPEVVMGEPETFKPVGVVMAIEVTVPLPVPAQTPLIAKQPEAMSIPLEKVEVALSEMYESVPMPKRVETVNLGKVEVAMVEVATKY